jgi:hypothetical protein
MTFSIIQLVKDVNIESLTKINYNDLQARGWGLIGGTILARVYIKWEKPQKKPVS